MARRVSTLDGHDGFLRFGLSTIEFAWVQRAMLLVNDGRVPTADSHARWRLFDQRPEAA